MKYNPLRSSHSYTFYLVSLLYTAGTAVLFIFNVLETTPILWAYFILSSIAELYYLIGTAIEVIEYLKGRRFVLDDVSLTYYIEDEKRCTTVNCNDLLEFKYDKKGHIDFVYKRHARRERSFDAHVFNKRECEFMDSIIERIKNKNAKVNLHK